MTQAPRVMALVLTYEAPDALRRCISAIEMQTTPPARVRVTDNASRLPASQVLRECKLNWPVEVDQLPENLGPAGGHAAGLRSFLASDCDYAWVMDDDCVPSPSALEELMRVSAATASPGIVLSTIREMESGKVANTQGWCSVLIPRGVVAAVGVPNADLFWWTEDTEYLQWRIPRAGFGVTRAALAEVHVPRSRASRDKPAWKYFYEARNQVYHRIHVQKPTVGMRVPHHLKIRVRAYRALRATGRLLGRALLVDRNQRFRKAAMVLRGARDGLVGRLGKTVPVSGADRPLG